MRGRLAGGQSRSAHSLTISAVSYGRRFPMDRRDPFHAPHQTAETQS